MSETELINGGSLMEERARNWKETVANKATLPLEKANFEIAKISMELKQLHQAMAELQAKKIELMEKIQSTRDTLDQLLKTYQMPEKLATIKRAKQAKAATRRDYEAYVKDMNSVQREVFQKLLEQKGIDMNIGGKL